MKTIILCGGMGTRLREETEYKPKPMVEIGEKPILWHIMKIYAHYGYKDFILALGYKGNVIRDYFLNYQFYNSDVTLVLGTGGDVSVHNDHSESDWSVTLVETGQNSMTGYRVKCCEKYVTGDDFMLTYGDAVSNVDISALVDFHKSHNKLGTVTGVFPTSRFGDLIADGDFVTKFKEKDKNLSHSNPINGGFFVFKREFLTMLPLDPTCDLERSPLEELTRKKQFMVYKHHGFWQCMDTFRDYQLLNQLWNTNPAWKVWK
jgi:glucose-1-phosphate cytidylyltransferase